MIVVEEAPAEPVKKKRGKKQEVAESVAPVEEVIVVEEAPAEPVKKKRGKKQEVAESVAPVEEVIVVEEAPAEPVKKKRGKKQEVAESVAPVEEVIVVEEAPAEPVKKKRGKKQETIAEVVESVEEVAVVEEVPAESEKEIAEEKVEEQAEEKVEESKETEQSDFMKQVQKGKSKSNKVTTRTTYPDKINFRLSQIYFALNYEKVDGIFISYLPNIRYLTGFSGSSAYLFVFKNAIHFITDDRYEEQIKSELYPLPNLRTHITRDLWKYVLQIGLLENIESIAFEADRVSYYEAVEYRNLIRPVKFKPTPALIEPFTQAKAPEELAYIKQSCQIAEKVYEKMLEFIKPGMTEKDVAIEIAYQGRKLGAEGDAFDIIVTSGVRGALVHGQPTDKKIRKGDIVIMDFGFKVNGFCSDITRTICVGAKPSREQRNLYSLLRQAEMKAINAVLPGMNVKNLDAVARDLIKEAGFGEYFQHSLGHGLGLVPHENPIITFRIDDQNVPEDAVLAIEPGVYLPDKYGMRVEDNIFVTKNGAVMLTNAPDELPYIM